MSRGFAAVVTWFAFVLVADTTLASSSQSKVKLVNNGYKDLVVAIAESVPDSQSTTAIARIKVWAPLLLIALSFKPSYMNDRT